jgi:hypothetical protein
MAFDPKTHNILLVTAKAKEGRRRAFEPGTFVILVVGSECSGGFQTPVTAEQLWDAFRAVHM